MSIYLEVSGRQTGKTTRLVAAVWKTVSEGKYSPIVVCANSYMAGAMSRKVPACCLVITHNEIDKPYVREVLKPRYFYDDFDFLDASPIRVIRSTDYYCSTLSRLRRRRGGDKYDLFFKVWRAANRRVHNFKQSDPAVLAKAERKMKDADYRREMLGEIWE